MKQPRLTPRAALALWPERLAAVTTEPTEDNLQRLCSLLDVLDRDLVTRWDQEGHADRRATLSGFRRQAQKANQSLRSAEARRMAS